MKTKYRTVSNGHWEWLEYKDESLNWLGFRRSTWRRVPKPYYHKVYGRSLGDISDTGTENWVNSLDDNIQKFIKANPDIYNYLAKTWAYIDKAEQKAKQHWKDVEQKRGKTNYLN